MKKLFLLCFKLIPLLTIIQGVLSGGSKLGPAGDALQTAMTQYEVSQILTVLSDHPEVVNSPETFPVFLQKNFHNQYSVLVRSLMGESSPDLSRDIWGKPFHLQVFIEEDKMKMGSRGPDGLIDTKDDVAAVLTVDFSSLRAPKRIKKVREVPVAVEEVEEVPRAEVAMDEEEEYNRGPAADEEYLQDQVPQEYAENHEEEYVNEDPAHFENQD